MDHLGRHFNVPAESKHREFCLCFNKNLRPEYRAFLRGILTIYREDIERMVRQSEKTKSPLLEAQKMVAKQAKEVEHLFLSCERYENAY